MSRALFELPASLSELPMLSVSVPFAADLSRSQLVLVDFGSAELFVQNPFAKDTCDYLAGG